MLFFEGALMRIRPVLMTVITEFAGLLPIFIFARTWCRCYAPDRTSDGRRHDHNNSINPDCHSSDLFPLGRQKIQPTPTH